jgi:hypothetical protein
MLTRPCVGCGYCCKKVPCSLSVYLHADKPWPHHECPELIFRDGRWWCKIALEEPELAKEELYIGAGCCSPLNTERLRYVDRMDMVVPDTPTLGVVPPADDS